MGKKDDKIRHDLVEFLNTKGMKIKVKDEIYIRIKNAFLDYKKTVTVNQIQTIQDLQNAVLELREALLKAKKRVVAPKPAKPWVQNGMYDMPPNLDK